MIRAVLLDCFGVLYIPQHQALHQSLLIDPSVHHDEILDLLHQEEYGLIDTETLFEGISLLTGQPLATVRQLLGHDFARNQQLLDYAQTLRPRHKLGLLSNIGLNSMQRYFSADEQQQLFDTVIASSSVGMIKPHPEIFEYACRQLGVDTSETVMVDDTDENCEGARNAGLLAVHFESTQQVMNALDALLMR